MNWTSPLFICSGITGVSFLIVGVVTSIWLPRTINGFYGYRTARSKRNQAAWDFAQMHSNRLMIWIAILNVLAGVLGLFLQLPKLWSVLISLSFMIMTVIYLFLSTERALKDKFGE